MGLASFNRMRRQQAEAKSKVEASKKPAQKKATKSKAKKAE